MSSIFDQLHVWELIIAECEPLTLATLQRVSRLLHRAVSLHYTHIVHKGLNLYFDDIPSFQYNMAATQSAISGSWVIKTLFRHHVPPVCNDGLESWESPTPQDWQSKDLDIYVKKTKDDRAIMAMHAYLLSEGYTVLDYPTDALSCWKRTFGERPPPATEEEMWSGLEYVDFNDAKQHASSNIASVTPYVKNGRTIDLIESSGIAIEPVAQFHSTVVMNFAYFDSITVLFPSQTLRGANLRNATCPTHPTKSEFCIRKYSKRGFKLPIQDPTICVQNVSIRGTQYRVGCCRVQLLPDIQAILGSNAATASLALGDEYSAKPSSYDEIILSKFSIATAWATRCNYAEWLLQGSDRTLYNTALNKPQTENGMEID